MRCFSQNGFLTVTQDQRINQLIQKQSEIYSADNTIKGFRIQIFMDSGNDAINHANIIMKEFKQKHPNIPIYLIFSQPYYRLRVGNYRNRLEAEKAFLQLSKIYKNAFITAERIELPYNVYCDTNIMINDSIFNDNKPVIIDSIYYENDNE